MKEYLFPIALLLSSCSLTDPSYQRSGGKFYGATNPASLRQFNPDLFSQFKVGLTTKTQVLNDLGRPYGWHTAEDGVLQLHYRYAGASSGAITRMVFPNFYFSKDQILIRMNNTTWKELR